MLSFSNLARRCAPSQRRAPALSKKVKKLDICKFRKNRVYCENYLSNMSKLEKSMLEFGLNILPERNSYDKNATTKDTRGI